jgi:PKD repeat protein
MRSIQLMAATLVTLTLATACGGDGGNGPNDPPVANFTAPACTAGVACQFTDASTDDNGITSREWDFGDLSGKSTDVNPTHIYAAAGDYIATLTVKDAAGESNTKSQTVHVTGGTNQSPVASFDLPTCTAGTPCGFHSTSTDPDGTIASGHWDFGDGETGEGLDATHTYAAAGTYVVTLTVTDNLGGTGVADQSITVSPATSQNCTTTGTQVSCSLGITQRSTVTFTVVSRSCELVGNTLRMTAPRDQFIFFNLCTRTVGEQYVAKDATGAPLVLEAGTSMALLFNQGTADVGDPATGDPGIQVSGTFPSWTLNIDDGGNAGALGEPDFDDAVISVTATPAP